MNITKSVYQFPAGQEMHIVHGDLLIEEVDVIVNAANKALVHGGGIAGLIVKRGGEIIQSESDRWVEENGPITHLEPAYTTAGRLPCKKIIHAAGPIWGEGSEEEKLSDTIKGSLTLAGNLKYESIGLPAISTGIFGFPKQKAAPIVFESIRSYFKNNPGTTLKIVKIVLYDLPTLKVFLQEYDNWNH